MFRGLSLFDFFRWKGTGAASHAASGAKNSRWCNPLICFCLALATLAASWPVLGNGFVNFDDGFYIYNNPHVFHGLTVDGFKWAFTTTGRVCNWHPVTWLSLMLDCQLFGERLWLHHLENVCWHVANSLLLFGFLRRISAAPWRSAVVAALFALHPLHVESVAWASERKDVLSTFFGFLALHAYLRYVERPAVPRYFGVLLFFAMSLLCKPMWVTFPFLLLLLDFWPLRRVSIKEREPIPTRTWQRLAMEKIPLLCLSAASSVVTYLAQQAGGAVMAKSLAPFYIHLYVAVIAYVVYLQKMFWPRDLAVLYPFPVAISVWEVVVAGAVLAAVTLGVIWLRRKHPYLAVGWFWYLGMLVPAIGIVQVGSQAMADRYTYVPLIGVFILMVWGIADFGARMRHGAWLLAAGSVAVLLGCAVGTWHQVQYWKDSVTLFQHSLAIRPDSAVAQHNLGSALFMRGDFKAAIPHYEESLRLWPGFALAHCDLADSLNQEGRTAEALEHYRTSLELDPACFQAHYGLAATLASQGNFAEARAHYLEALRLEPDYIDAHVKFGNMLVNSGDLNAAVPHYLAAIKIRPDCLEAQLCLAGVLARQSNFVEAVAHYREVLKINNTEPSILNDLAWTLATADDPKVHDAGEAVQLAQRACELEHDQSPSHLDTLAVAYSEAGRFDEAVGTARKAVALARSSGKEHTADKIQEHLRFFEQNRSYRAATRSETASPAKP